MYRGAASSAVDANTTTDDLLASYWPGVTTLTVGPTTARALILYDSVNRMSNLINRGGAVVADAGVLSRAARAEGRGPLILKTEGTIYFEPSTWSLGQIQAYGMRLGAFEQDPESGTLLLHPDYSMWNEDIPTLGVSAQPATWANTEGWVWERRTFRVFTTSNGNGGIQYSMRWSGRRRLKPDQCWAFYLEGENTSVNARIQPFFRSLVSDEG